eukprot:2336859-Amphidinium_carterae.1
MAHACLQCHHNAQYKFKSMTVAFQQWCDDNWPDYNLAKFLENDGRTIKPQYVTATMRTTT